VATTATVGRTPSTPRRPPSPAAQAAPSSAAAGRRSACRARSRSGRRRQQRRRRHQPRARLPRGPHELCGHARELHRALPGPAAAGLTATRGAHLRVPPPQPRAGARRNASRPEVCGIRRDKGGLRSRRRRAGLTPRRRAVERAAPGAGSVRGLPRTHPRARGSNHRWHHDPRPRRRRSPRAPRGSRGGAGGRSPVGVAADGAGMERAVHRMAPDVVVLDRRLGDEDGLAVCAGLRERDDAPGVVSYTADDDPALMAEARAAGASGTVAKDRGIDGSSTRCASRCVLGRRAPARRAHVNRSTLGMPSWARRADASASRRRPPSATAARTAGSRRGESTRPPSACRSAPAPRTRCRPRARSGSAGARPRSAARRIP
jgi:CheY-like chemotaxis protein